MQHQLVSGSEEGRAILAQCTQWRCPSCSHQFDAGELQYLAGRPIVARRINDAHYTLFACSHCTFRDLSCRSQHCKARFDVFNAPLDQAAARHAARAMGDTAEEYLVLVVV